MRLPFATAVLLFLGTAMALPAQTLTLRDALGRADRAAYANRIALGTAATQGAQATAALRGILPTVRVEGGFARTNDPIGAFGTTLRQRAITPTDFDPGLLNHPDAVTNYLGGLVIEQPIFNADAWVGRRAALRGAAASASSAEWTSLDTRVDVIRAYYGATLAEERVAALRSGVRAAQAHVRQTEAMVRQGLVTKSDALLAAVKAGELEAQLAEAEAESGTARSGLALLLGDGTAAAVTVPGRLPGSEAIRAAVADDMGAQADPARADVEAAQLGLDAARLDTRRAESLYLPRVNAFARYDWNSATQPYGGERSWTVGVMASWSPFAGASEIAEVQATRGRARAAGAMADAAREGAALDVERTGNQLRAALARLAIAERSVEQSTEAHRIVARKYAGGLATVIELLDAAAMETQSTLGLSHARFAVITSGAERRQALGLDPGALAVLDAAPAAVAANTH